MKKNLQPLTPAARYARVSSDRQDVDLSVAAQRNDLVAAFAHKLAAFGKPPLTPRSPANANLAGPGAGMITAETMSGS